MVLALFESTGLPWSQLRKIAVVGNTVMQHLMLAFPLEQLAMAPHVPYTMEEQTRSTAELGWHLPVDVPLRFLPNLGGFVGSDILGVILATRILESDVLVASADLGTNGEIVAGSREGVIVSSTAAGPAFEGGRIEMGMRAGKGAISRVSLVDGRMEAQVIGGGTPRGICGSGLVDAVAAGLELGLIQPTGRITEGIAWSSRSRSPLRSETCASCSSPRPRLLPACAYCSKNWVRQRRMSRGSTWRAFGNTLGVTSAERIGLFRFGSERTIPVGNAALRGAKIALLSREGGVPAGIQERIRFLNLSARPRFQELFAEEMLLDPEPM